MDTVTVCLCIAIDITLTLCGINEETTNFRGLVSPALPPLLTPQLVLQNCFDIIITGNALIYEENMHIEVSQQYYIGYTYLTLYILLCNVLPK